MRADAPFRRGGNLAGALPAWRDESDQQRALEELERDAHASSTRESNESRLRTLHRALDAWGMDPFPPTLRAVGAFAATLKRGRYRSAASYLWHY